MAGWQRLKSEGIRQKADKTFAISLAFSLAGCAFSSLLVAIAASDRPGAVKLLRRDQRRRRAPRPVRASMASFSVRISAAIFSGNPSTRVRTPA